MSWIGLTLRNGKAVSIRISSITAYHPQPNPDRNVLNHNPVDGIVLTDVYADGHHFVVTETPAEIGVLVRRE